MNLGCTLFWTKSLIWSWLQVMMWPFWNCRDHVNPCQHQKRNVGRRVKSIQIALSFVIFVRPNPQIRSNKKIRFLSGPTVHHPYQSHINPGTNMCFMWLELILFLIADHPLWEGFPHLIDQPGLLNLGLLLRAMEGYEKYTICRI